MLKTHHVLYGMWSKFFQEDLLTERVILVHWNQARHLSGYGSHIFIMKGYLNNNDNQITQ